MPKLTKEEKIAKLEAELDTLSKKEKEGDWHKMQRQHVLKHDKLTAAQKKMNELERKIRALKGQGGRRTRRRHRTRSTRSTRALTSRRR